MKLTDLGLKKKTRCRISGMSWNCHTAFPDTPNRICIQVTTKISCHTCSCSRKDQRIEAYWGCISTHNRSIRCCTIGRSIWWITWDSCSWGTIWRIARTSRGWLGTTIIQLKIKKRVTSENQVAEINLYDCTLY